MNLNAPQKLTYFLSEKKSVLIVTLIGPLIRPNAAHLEECFQEVTARNSAAYVIINMRDVPEKMDINLVSALARLQKFVRDRGATLKMSGVHPGLRSFLQERGVLREDEICDNLSQALQIGPLNETKKNAA